MQTGIKANQSASLPEHPERATLEGKNKVLGVWFFLGGETVLFASFFGTFLALRDGTANGPSGAELFSLPLVFIMTMLLLTSSLTSVLAVWAMQSNEYRKMQRWLTLTVLLGFGFLAFEIFEFVEYAHQGLRFSTSAFSSAFYTLVGCHGAHVTFGLIWIILLQLQGMKKGINLTTAPKYYVASLYWHFIDVVWVFIFTVVYLMGKVG